MTQIPRIVPVTAFVDWNSQIHAAQGAADASPIALGRHTLSYLGRVIGRSLADLGESLRFDVTLRLYHGWYKGFEATPRRKAMVEVFAGTDFTSLSKRPNVVIRPSLQFGDSLLSALPARLHPRLACHLPNTHRREIEDKTEFEEKMVDTAIASEFVDMAHREPERWLVLLGDDDDLVPPVFVAEGIRAGQGGKIVLIRRRPETPFLKLDQLRYVP